MTAAGPAIASSLVSAVRPKQPYPGLRPFMAGEWSIFFGREPMIDEVIERLGRQQIVIIHGASGSGKSSLVRAGVLPKLARQHLRHGVPWLTCAMRPSGGPLWNLALEFAGLEGRTQELTRISEIAGLFNQRGATLASVAGALSGVAGKRLCILVDQFEELFRFERETSREEAELFVNLLIGAIEDKSNSGGSGLEPARALDNEPGVEIHVVITMRSEFLGECARFDGFAEAINQTQYLVPHMNREAMLRAIRRPAQLYGGEVSIELAERLIAGVRGKEDELPLIQHGLMLMWNAAASRPDEKITLDAGPLDRAGSLANLLSDHADSIMAEASPAGQSRNCVETLFRALIDVNAEGLAIRRPQSFRNLRALVNIPESDLRAIIDAFRADGVSFLAPYQPAAIKDDTVIDVSHEALIRCWRKIAGPQNGWLKNEVDDGLVWRSLLVEAKGFETNRKRVLSPATTHEREQWLATHTKPWSERYGGGWPLVNRLLQASRKVSDSSRLHSSLAAAALTLLAVSTTVLAVVAFSARDEAIEQRLRVTEALAESQIQESLYLAVQSHQQLDAGQPLTALQLALRGSPTENKRPWVAETFGALLEAVGGNRERRAFAGHTNFVLSANFSPDESRVLTASADGTARQWDVASGRKLASVRHYNAVYSATYSRDGKKILTASADYTARLWNAESGEQLALLRHGGLVKSAIFSPGGAQVLTSSGDNAARLWDTTSKKHPVIFLHGDSVFSASFSPSGAKIVTASKDGTARVWDPVSGEEILKLPHPSSVNSAVFSPDGATILTASDDSMARLWNAVSGEEIATLQGHKSSVKSALFSPDGARIVTLSDDKFAGLWDTTTRKLIDFLGGHRDSVISAAFSADGKYLVTGSKDHTALIWDAETGIEVGRLLGHSGSVRSVTFGSDGHSILTASSDESARLWQIDRKHDAALLTGHRDKVNSAIFSDDGKRVLTASQDTTARLWDVESGRELAAFVGHLREIMSAKFSPDETRVVTASRDGTAIVWEASSGQPLAVLKHADVVISAVFSPDGTRVLTASTDKTARIWDAVSGQQLGPPFDHDDAVTSAVFSPDGARILTASNDEFAKVWNATGPREPIMLTGHDDTINSAIFSPDGTRILTISDDTTARIWDAQTGKALIKFEGHTGAVKSAVFSSDGKRVLTASADGTARLWMAATGQEISLLKQHRNPVVSASFSPDEQRILLSSEDRTVSLWDAVAMKPLAVFRGYQSPSAFASFSPDSKYLITAWNDNTARVLWIGSSHDEVLAYARSTLSRNMSPEEEDSVFSAPTGQ